MFTIQQLAPGVRLYTLPTKQFKTITLSIKFTTQLTEENAGVRTVLSNLLQFSNQLTPTNSAFRQKLDELYGTSIYLDTMKRADRHTVYLNADFVNDAYLAEHNLTEEVLELIQAVLFKPLFTTATFDARIFDREKKQVQTRIESLYEDKSRYAQHRLMELIRPHHPASISATGDKELVQEVTLEQVIDAYHSMIANDEISIYVVGDIDTSHYSDLVTSYFGFEGREITDRGVIQPETSSFEETVEYMDMKQAKLHMAYETPVTAQSPEFPIMQILNGILGAYPHSKLFTNVREKESLAYYASSSFASSYGLLFAVSGIDPAQKNKAESLIDQQLEEIKNGNISDREFLQTKSMLKNQLMEIKDSARGLIEVYESYQEIDPDFTLDGWAKKWETISKQDVQQLAHSVQKIHTYFLTTKEEQHA